jgi:hypothetical protein
MMHATKIVVALLGLAAAAPAQLHIEGRFGNHVTVHADVGGHRGHHRAPRRAYPRPIAHAPHATRGHWETISERVWIPPSCQDVCVPATYGWTYDSCGHRVWGVVRPAHTRHVEVPGHFENRTRRVFVPGC